MLNLFSPISYNTDVNPIVFNYFMGNNPFGYNIYNNANSIFMPFSNYSNYFSPWQSTPYNIWSNTYNQPTNIYQNNDKYSYFGPYMNIYKMSQTSNTETSNKTTKQKNVENTNSNTTNDKPTKPKEHKSNYIGINLANNAKQYLGYNEADGSSQKFSDSKEWCADFVSYVVKETYRAKGLTPPQGFGNHRVEILKQWGIKNNKYYSLTDKTDKAKAIKNDIKIGDILILRENGASHTGFVSKINSDGSFEAIEGNRYDKVAIGKYSPNNPEISGFIQLTS